MTSSIDCQRQSPVLTRENFDARTDRSRRGSSAMPKANTSALERELDELVYALYGPTGGEKALVPSASKQQARRSFKRRFVTGFRRKLDVVFGKSGANPWKWAVCGHSLAGFSAAAGVDVDFPSACGDFSTGSGDFPVAAGD